MTNEELVLLALAGDQDAYTSLYNDNLRYARSVCAKLLQSWPDEINTVAHDALSLALVRLSQFKGTGGSKFRTWLYRITRNEALSFLRKRHQPVNDAVSMHILYPSGDEFFAEPTTKERSHVVLETTQLVDMVMARLSMMDRDALTARYLYGLRNTEVGITMSAAKARLHRALRNARAVLMEIHERNLRR